jgi:hypothetical protein
MEDGPTGADKFRMLVKKARAEVVLKSGREKGNPNPMGITTLTVAGQAVLDEQKNPSK